MILLFHAVSILSVICSTPSCDQSVFLKQRVKKHEEKGAEGTGKAPSEFLLKIRGKCERMSKYSNALVKCCFHKQLSGSGIH